MPEDEEFVEYEDMTVAELKAEADSREPAVAYKSSDNKATIIAALEQWDDEHEDEPVVSEETNPPPDDEPDVRMETPISEDAPPDAPEPAPEPGPRPTTYRYVLTPSNLLYLGSNRWETANWKACVKGAMDAGLQPVGDPRRVSVDTETNEIVYEVDVL